jgi:hypothetical protein
MTTYAYRIILNDSELIGNCSPPFGKIPLDTVTAESIHGGA